ncbi:MAG: preprotein translocase subunit SecG [Candidatus Omnitrophota bacterium]
MSVHVIVCLMLIIIILLQAGRGGGLSEAFGGDSSQTIFGTKVSVFLTRATVVAASLFLMTCLLLGIMTSRRGKSLIDLQGSRALPATIPLTEETPVDTEQIQEEVQPLKEEVEPLAKSEEPAQN